MKQAARKLLIVGIGGTAKASSSTESALIEALSSAQRSGASTRLFGGAFLTRLPHYLSGDGTLGNEGRELVDAVRRADGLIIAAPGYHGSLSGIVKNAIDYLEETAKDSRVYLDGLPVGLVATAYGWQAASSTLAALRSIVHALRGWPTPLGAALNCSGGIFQDGFCTDETAAAQLRVVGRQVVEFAELKALARETSLSLFDRRVGAA